MKTATFSSRIKSAPKSRNPGSKVMNKSAILPPRLRSLRDRVIHAPQEISIVRARALTEVIKNHPELSRDVQFALGLKETFRQLPISIADDERIVGAMTEKFKGAVINPELKSNHLINELDNFSEREVARFAISEADKEELRDRILPFWKDKSGHDIWDSLKQEEERRYERIIAHVTFNDFSGASSLSHVDYTKVLEQGFAGIAGKAKAAQIGLAGNDPDAKKKQSFYQSVILSAEAMMEFADRYSQLALEKASQVASPERARELREIAVITAQVPAHPARNFREALQSFWFTFVALRQTDGGMEVPLGRFDQFIHPYYQKDIETGKLTRAEALELIQELFIKINQTQYLDEFAATRVHDGSTQRLTLTVSGMDAIGKDTTNDLSYLILEAIQSLLLIHPNIAVRLHPGTPEAFWKRVIQVMTSGAGLIEVFNDEVIIPGLLKAGIPLETVRDYVITGCVQPIPPATYGPTCSGYLNVNKILELTLNDGAPLMSLAGMSTLADEVEDYRDNPTPHFRSYEELWEAYKAHARAVVASLDRSMYLVGETMDRWLPNTLLDAITEGTLENGKGVKAGGAHFNIWGISTLGNATLADSLAALKELVFEKKTHTLDEVVAWLKSDFEGYETERQMLLNRMPKFGNDDPRVDAIAKDIVDLFAELLDPYRTYRGGKYLLGIHSETHHIIQGMIHSASPDGRHTSEMLSPGCGPTSGMDKNGPTATLRSITAMDFTKLGAGASANLRFNPTLFRTDAHVEQFEALVKAYFKQGGQHLQINVADAETLRDAQRHPEKYEDLIVRVTGYSARFVELTFSTQEELIRRTEMAVC